MLRQCSYGHCEAFHHPWRIKALTVLGLKVVELGCGCHGSCAPLMSEDSGGRWGRRGLRDEEST